MPKLKLEKLSCTKTKLKRNFETTKIYGCKNYVRNLTHCDIAACKRVLIFGEATLILPSSFFDVRVFNPHAPSNRQQNLAATYRKYENLKKRAYERQVREVEHASFTPLVMSLTGGLGHVTNVCFKRLASMLSSKWNYSYSGTTAWG